MYTCPQCQNVILKEVHFCNRCGYRLSAALAQSALTQLPQLPHTPPEVPMVYAPTPKRTIRPHVTDRQYSQELINQPSQETQADQQSMVVEGATASSLTHKESQPPTSQLHGLIRPIGAQEQQGLSPNRELPAHIGKIIQEPSHSRFSSWTSSNQEQTPPGLLAPPVLPLEDLSTGHIPIVVVKGKPQLFDTLERIEQYSSDESFVATSIVAEHWRTSWRNRQRTEAGPATTVSRGHSSVPEPLLAMQHSLLRMRAIIIPNKTKDITGPSFWIIIVLMLCLLGGLAVYIISTYLPATGKPGHVNIHLVTPQPTLTIRRTDGKEISLHTSNLGAFNVAQPVTSAWPAKSEQLIARDNTSDAHLTIQFIEPGSSTS
jgi:hypothetical protein